MVVYADLHITEAPLNFSFLKEDIKNNIENNEDFLKKYKDFTYPTHLDITDKLYSLHIQERNLSCEISATSDILSQVFQTGIKEVDIIDFMKKETTYSKPSYIDENGKRVWGNPELGFVGDIDGHQYNLTGYAIYEKPLSEIYKRYGVNYYTYNKFEKSLGFATSREALTHFLKELYFGNYVQIWGDYCTDSKYEDGNIDRKITTEESLQGKSQKNTCYSIEGERMIEWYTEDGEKIYAPIQSHNFILLGYEGDIYNPDNIIVWDTQTGKHTYPLKEWMRKWNFNGARAIVIDKNA